MADTLRAIADLIWPALAIAVLIFVYVRRKTIGPPLKKFLENRNVKAQAFGIGVEVGSQSVSAQQAIDDQRRHTEQLREQLSLLSSQVAALQEAAPGRADAVSEAAIEVDEPLTRRVLWVDDQPTNNAYEIASLQDRGVHVDIATSTAEALNRLARQGRVDAIVTDMHRDEDGESVSTAGLDLLRKLRERSIDIPVVVYASRGAVDRYRADAQQLGAIGATADPTELLELLAVNYGPGFSTRFKQQVENELRANGYTAELEPRDSPIDFRARHDGATLGIDVKSTWRRRTAPDRVIAKFTAIEERAYDFPVWIVTPEPVALPAGVRPPDRVELLTFGGLRDRLRVE
jgi:CheY-like chemotaxis protein